MTVIIHRAGGLHDDFRASQKPGRTLERLPHYVRVARNKSKSNLAQPPVLGVLIGEQDYGKRNELFERHAVLGVDVEQLLRDRRETQSLLHDVDADKEGGSDLFLGLALMAQCLKRGELVEG